MAETVTVLCRLPHGIELRIIPDGEIERRTKLSEDKRPDLRPISVLSRVVLNGANTAPNYHPKDNRMLGRVGKTAVDKAFWLKWVEQHAKSDLVKNHVVFAEQTDARADAKAREFADIKTGYEPTSMKDVKASGVEVVAA